MQFCMDYYSRVRTRIENNAIDDERLTMKFIYNALFEKKGHEPWETEFLKKDYSRMGLFN
jgi:hypothetical protein